jgi:hypothetical protein
VTVDVQAPVQTNESSLAGFVYMDVDPTNQTKDAAESGVSGVTITLTGTDSSGKAVNTSQTTASDGSYKFAGLNAGSYTITETQPTTLTYGSEQIGSQGGDASVPNTFTIQLAADTTGANNNFAELGEKAIYISLRDFLNVVASTSSDVATASDSPFSVRALTAGASSTIAAGTPGRSSAADNSAAIPSLADFDLSSSDSSTTNNGNVAAAVDQLMTDPALLG